MTAILDAYLNKTSGADYKTAVARECRKQLESIVKAGEAVKYGLQYGAHLMQEIINS